MAAELECLMMRHAALTLECNERLRIKKNSEWDCGSQNKSDMLETATTSAKTSVVLDREDCNRECWNENDPRGDGPQNCRERDDRPDKEDCTVCVGRGMTREGMARKTDGNGMIDLTRKTAPCALEGQ